MSAAEVARAVRAEEAAKLVPPQDRVRRKLFLDLEDTVITPVVNGWLNTQVINKAKVREFIEEFQPHDVNIFSFAIWNEHELRGFNHGTRPMLEQALGVQFSAVPTVDGEIIPACCKVMNLAPETVDFQEMSNFWGKHEAFRLNMRHIFRHSNLFSGQIQVVLLDDAVFNEHFDWPDLHVSGRIINIDTL